jgi:inosine/xanthosine triphosphatase
MEKIIIAVGSKRGPKLGAVTDALEDIGPLLPGEGEFEVVGAEVESGVGHTPASSEESMRGARHRAEALVKLARETNEPWNYFVGLEGGLEVLEEEAGAPKKKEKARESGTLRRRVLLESWAYVSDGKQGYYGRSGGIELPEALAQEVLDNGTELSAAIDKFAGKVGIRDGQGAWGVLSGNLISRQDAFRVAVVAAFAPFYNAKMYSAHTGKRAKQFF